MDLREALGASGLVCVVGAGGKKTTLYTLARRFNRAVVTSTVRIPIFDAEVAQVLETADPVGAVREASPGNWPLGLVPRRDRGNRYAGYETQVVSRLAEATLGETTDAVLVKADGARNRLLKAPNESEPQLPGRADTVIPIASARVVGEPLGEDKVHRPERVGEIADLELGETITPADVGAVLASHSGGRKDAPEGATVRPMINMVDTSELAETGRKIAQVIFERTDAIDRVALTRMDEGTLVDIVQR